MTPQSTFMMAAPIKEGSLDALSKLLATMTLPESPGMADPKNQLVPFAEFDHLHFARFVILDDHTLSDVAGLGLATPSYAVRLAFLGDCDGTEDFFVTVARHPVAAAGLRKIFAHCEGFDTNADLAAWMKRYEHPPAAAYVNWRGRTVRQVCEEAALRDVLVKYVNENCAQLRQASPQEIHAKLKAHAGAMTLSDPATTPPDWRVKNLLHFALIPAALLLPWPLAFAFLTPLPVRPAWVVIPVVVLSALVFLWLVRRAPASFALLVALGLLLVPLFLLFPVLLLAVGFAVVVFLFILRRHEKHEPEIIPKPSAAHVDALAELEDHDVSNQYSLVGSVKPSRFRQWLLVVILWLTDYGARHIYNRGHLGRIQTIHFARWVFLDGGRRVFFASNYDGSDEAYMDDFINKVGWGLNLTFASGIGYPRTNWLIKDGCKDEQKFKATNRRHQIPTQVWYKAYPGLTGFDLARNARVRQGFQRNSMSDEEIRTWLSDL